MSEIIALNTPTFAVTIGTKKVAAGLSVSATTVAMYGRAAERAEAKAHTEAALIESALNGHRGACAALTEAIVLQLRGRHAVAVLKKAGETAGGAKARAALKGNEAALQALAALDEGAEQINAAQEAAKAGAAIDPSQWGFGAFMSIVQAALDHMASLGDKAPKKGAAFNGFALAQAVAAASAK